jgi:hypothetical protein
MFSSSAVVTNLSVTLLSHLTFSLFSTGKLDSMKGYAFCFNIAVAYP